MAVITGTGDVAGSAGSGWDDRNQDTSDDQYAAAVAVLRMIWGIHISRAVYVAAELGVADLLADGPMTTARLAVLTETHEPSLYRVFRLLAGLGVLTERSSGRSG